MAQTEAGNMSMPRSKQTSCGAQADLAHGTQLAKKIKKAKNTRNDRIGGNNAEDFRGSLLVQRYRVRYKLVMDQLRSSLFPILDLVENIRRTLPNASISRSFQRKGFSKQQTNQRARGIDHPAACGENPADSLGFVTK